MPPPRVVGLPLRTNAVPMTSHKKSQGATAVISEDGRHRYALGRRIPGGKHSVLFVMLNPSTADAEEDDPTIRKCVGFAKQWGFGSLLVGNLYSTRATDPDELLAEYHQLETFEEKNWPDQVKWLTKMAEGASAVVCAWGAHKAPFKRYREYEVAKVLWEAGHKDLECLGVNKDKTPKHPLYLPWTTDLEEFVLP